MSFARSNGPVCWDDPPEDTGGGQRKGKASTLGCGSKYSSCKTLCSKSLKDIQRLCVAFVPLIFTEHTVPTSVFFHSADGHHGAFLSFFDSTPSSDRRTEFRMRRQLDDRFSLLRPDSAGAPQIRTVRASAKATLCRGHRHGYRG